MPRKRSVIYALIAWSFWVFLFAVAQRYSHGFSFQEALRNSLFYNAFFLPFSIPIWYLCSRVAYGRLPTFLFLLVHFATALVIATIWFLSWAWWLRWVVGPVIFEQIHVETFALYQVLNAILIYAAMVGVIYTATYYRNYRDRLLAEAELRSLAREAELKALKLQINPHFMFNTLNSVSALVGQDAGRARGMLNKLADLLRITLDSSEKKTVPFEEETSFARTYLDIEQARFGRRLTYREEVQREALGWRVPPVILQPLVENAIRHGISGMTEGGDVVLRAAVDEGRLVIEVENSAPGEAEPVEEGVGLRSVRERLEQMHGRDGGMEIRREPGRFTVRLVIPPTERSDD